MNKAHDTISDLNLLDGLNLDKENKILNNTLFSTSP
ncbi:uncharacterized protein FRV6_06886 [Fusarium oxysporum]|uniref:Uncharacterized protein n=1 Tax=Fusarium oxysporum TaxID=5507 RepID=A0A2H3TLL6_FUSOX|nr:uncharacterized protein FRV6_06886 [Fusarium oxysporum]